MTVSAPSLVVNGADDSFRDLVDSLILFAAQIQKVRQVLSTAMGVTQPQYNILMILAHQRSRQSITVKKLAEHMNVTPSYVVVETNRLLAQGLLRKETGEEDRREINLQLTDAAVRLIANAGPLQRCVNDALFGGLSKEDFKSLSHTIKMLIARYEPTMGEAKEFVSKSSN